VLLTPIVRRSFNEQGTLVDTHGAYPLVVRDVARDRAVAFVDLQLLTGDLVRSAGVEGSTTRTCRSPAPPRSRGWRRWRCRFRSRDISRRTAGEGSRVRGFL
jgi:hypothetical protein